MIVTCYKLENAMRRFDQKGMMIWPFLNDSASSGGKDSGIMVVENCYCQNGHNLVSNRVKFNVFNGILLKIAKDSRAGFIALSPVIGDKSRISIDIDIAEGKVENLLCPQCDAQLPVYAPCNCGGKLISLFLHADANFADCVGVCSRFGCKYAEVRSGDDLIHTSGAQAW